VQASFFMPGEICTHIEVIETVKHPQRRECEDCVKIGSRWVHLRTCQTCGGTRCCDNSPNRHATAHFHEHTDHPVIRSYEPGENWWYCYADDLAFEVQGAAPSPSHP
jgi:Zn-finger in ubiquitin-hydrolases and other protein